MTRNPRQQGQILVLFALALVGFLGLLGLVVDGGFLYVQRRTAQAAADAGALAGARAMRDACTSSCDMSTISPAVFSQAQANAFGIQPTLQCVYLVDASGHSMGSLYAASGASCPSGVASLNGASGVHVDVRITYPSIIVGMLRISSFNADGHATAQLGAPSSMYTTDSPLIVCGGGTGGGAMRVSTTPSVTVTNGSVIQPTQAQLPLPTYAVTNQSGYTMEQFLTGGTTIDQSKNGHVYYIKGSSIGASSNGMASDCGAGSNTFDGGASQTNQAVIIPGPLLGTNGNSVATIGAQVEAPGGCGAGTNVNLWSAGSPGCVMLLPIANGNSGHAVLNVQLMGAFYVYCNKSSNGGNSNCQEWLGQLIADEDITSGSISNISLSGLDAPSGPIVVHLTQ